MNSIPNADDLDLRHPSWCSPEHCTAPDSLRARGISELEVDRHLRDQHWSAPRTIGDDDQDRMAEASFEFALTRWVYQPLEDGRPDQLVLTIRFTEYLLAFAVPMSGPQVRVAREAFAEYADAFPVGGAS